MTTCDLYNHAGQVPLDVWEYRGVRVPIIDIDNTLTDFHGESLLPEVVEGLRSQNLADRFVGIGLASNGTEQRRVNYIRDLVKAELDVEVYGVSAETFPKKPNPAMGEDIAGHFDVETNELGVIGDRWWTDVRFGRKLGARAVAMCDKVGDGDAKGVPLLRIVESGLVIVERTIRTVEDNRMPMAA